MTQSVNVQSQGLSHDISASPGTTENSSSFTSYLISQHFYNDVLSSAMIIKIKKNELFFLRGGRLLSEMHKPGVITNNSNTKSIFVCLFVCNPIFSTLQTWLHFYFLLVHWTLLFFFFFCWKETMNAVSFPVFPGRESHQNTACKSLSCEREENCQTNHRANVLQENLAHDNALFRFSYQLHNINTTFRQGKCFYASLSHTPAHR